MISKEIDTSLHVEWCAGFELKVMSCIILRILGNGVVRLADVLTTPINRGFNPTSSACQTLWGDVTLGQST